MRRTSKFVLSVVTSESQGFVYGRADILQVGNEPDVDGTRMSPQDYAAQWNLYRDTYDGAFPYFALAGLGSGLTNSGEYLSAVWPLLNHKPDFVAVHCYDADVQQASQEIVDLWNRVGVPVIVTEWNHPNDQIWDMLDMLNGAEGLSSVWNSYYPYTTAMNSGTPGLVDADGQPTPQGASFVSAPSV